MAGLTPCRMMMGPEEERERGARGGGGGEDDRQLLTLRNKSAGHDAQNWIYRRRIAVGPILEPGPFSSLERVPYSPFPLSASAGKARRGQWSSSMLPCAIVHFPPSLLSLYHRGREDVPSKQYPLLPFTLPQTRFVYRSVPPLVEKKKKKKKGREPYWRNDQDRN